MHSFIFRVPLCRSSKAVLGNMQMIYNSLKQVHATKPLFLTFTIIIFIFSSGKVISTQKKTAWDTVKSRAVARLGQQHVSVSSIPKKVKCLNSSTSQLVATSIYHIQANRSNLIPKSSIFLTECRILKNSDQNFLNAQLRYIRGARKEPFLCFHYASINQME